MKTLQPKFNTLFFLLLTSILFAGCSKDKTLKNKAPNSFSLNKVPDGAAQPELSWGEAIDPEGDDVTYKVYLGTENPPQTIIANNLELNTFKVEDALKPEVTYYWKVVAKDTKGNTTESDVDSFRSRDMTNEEKIVGRWFYEKIEAGEGNPLSLSECYKKGFFDFAEGSKLLLEVYAENGEGKCEADMSETWIYQFRGEEDIEATNEGSGASLDMHIRSLTATELVLVNGSTIYTLTKEE